MKSSCIFLRYLIKTDYAILQNSHENGRLRAFLMSDRGYLFLTFMKHELNQKRHLSLKDKQRINIDATLTFVEIIITVKRKTQVHTHFT